MERSDWLDKPYYSLDAYMKQTYGQKVYKIAVDAGLTCPNRDGTIGSRGCTFCSAGGSGDFAVPLTEAACEHRSGVDHFVYEHRFGVDGSVYEHRSGKDATVCQSRSNEVYHREYARRGTNSDRQVIDVTRQIERGLAKFHKKAGERFVIYFQAYTNTYGDPRYLERIWRAALDRPEVVGISIATRPDCLGLKCIEIEKETPIDLLRRLQAEYAEKGKFIWVEFGLQTMHEKTAMSIRRGYPLSVYEDAVEALADCNIPYITHVILGLPGEDTEDMYKTVRYVCDNPNLPKPFGIKLQLLHVLRGTDLYTDYEAGKFETLSMDAYIELVISCLEMIPEDIVIHRVTGDGPKNILVAPLWSGNKRLVLNTLHKKMREEGRKQGSRVKKK